MANSPPTDNKMARNSLAIRGVGAAYGSVRALEDISLSVEHAETVVLRSEQVHIERFDEAERTPPSS